MSSPRSARDSLSPEPRSFPSFNSGFNSGAFNPAAGAAGGAFMPAPVHRTTADPSRLFTADELALLPAAALDRQKLKAQAKKAKKRRAAAERTEGELLLGFMDMEVDEQQAQFDAPPRPSGKKARQEKKAAAAKRAPAPVMQVDPEVQKEEDFAKFLSNMGGKCIQLGFITIADTFHSGRLGRGALSRVHRILYSVEYVDGHGARMTTGATFGRKWDNINLL
jgi:nuclear GTP-binding protein